MLKAVSQRYIISQSRILLQEDLGWVGPLLGTAGPKGNDGYLAFPQACATAGRVQKETALSEKLLEVCWTP